MFLCDFFDCYCSKICLFENSLYRHGRFCHRERMLIQSENFDSLPHRQYEITNQWDLGGDGKCFWGLAPDEEWFIRFMRK